MKKRILSIITTLALCLSLLPTAALAAEGDVASVGSTNYTTLADALTAVASNTDANTTVKLLASVSDNFTISGGTFTLDLNGHTISGVAPVKVESGANVTITDNSASTTSGTISVTSEYGTVVSNSGTLTITGGTISGGRYGVSNNSGGAVNISGSASIKDTTNGVNNSSGGTLNISGNASISATSRGVYNTGGEVSISISASISGGVYNEGTTGAVNISGGTISGGVINRGGIVTIASTPNITGSNSTLSWDSGGTFNLSGANVPDAGWTVYNTSNFSGNNSSATIDSEGNLRLPEGYAMYVDGEPVTTLAAGTIGTILSSSHTHTYDETDGTCVCGATKKSISIAEGIQNGAVTANKTSAGEGETVTLTVTPAEGYVLEELEVIKSSDSTTAVPTTLQNDGTYTFTMPASDVFVNARFDQLRYAIELVAADSTLEWSDTYGTAENAGKITVKNIGNVPAVFKLAVGDGAEIGGYEIADAATALTSGEVAPGETHTFRVKPVETPNAGLYEEPWTVTAYAPDAKTFLSDMLTYRVEPLDLSTVTLTLGSTSLTLNEDGEATLPTATLGGFPEEIPNDATYYTLVWTGPDNQEIEGKGDGQSGTTYSAKAPGVYTVTFTPAEGCERNYTGELSGKVAVSNKDATTVEEGDLTITLTPESATYTGQPIEPAVSVVYKVGDDTSITLVEDTDYFVSYANNVNAGTNTAKATISFAGQYKGMVDVSFSIAKKQIAVPTQPAAVTYNGEAQTYGVADTSDYTVSGGVQTNANETGHNVTIALTDKNNTEWASGGTDDLTQKFIINKAAITVAAKDQSVYVGGTAPSLSAPALNTHYTVTGLVGSDTLGGTIVMEYQKDGAAATPDTSKTGTYDIVISGATVPNDTNYSGITFTNGTLTISNRPYTPPSGGGGGGGSSTTTTTTKNEDGSTTTTTTNKSTGTVTETTKYPDGSSTTVETKKDGTVTTTEKTAEGVTGTTKTDADGTVTEVTTTVPSSAAKEAEENGEAVTLPIEVEAADAADEAAEIDVDVPSGGAKLEIPVEDVTPGTVVVIVNKDGTEEIVKTSTVSEAGVVVSLTGDATIKVIDNSKYFVDVHPVDHWATDAVDFVVAREIYSGTSATTFHPDNTMTRGMLAVVLHRLENTPDHNYTDSFTDVAEDSWYEDAIHWAADNGIVSGYGNGLYGPNDNITREQLAVMLWRYAGSPDSSHGLSHFVDADQISNYAHVALAWANENGIINGKGNNVLDPKGNATRAQVAQMLKNFIENIVK